MAKQIIGNAHEDTATIIMMNLTQSVCWHLPRRPAATFRALSIAGNSTVQTRHSRMSTATMKYQAKDLKAD